MHPHVQAILLAVATTGASGLALWALLAAVYRRRRQARPVPSLWKPAAVGLGVVTLGAAYLSMAFVGMTVNGGTYERSAVETAGTVRSIERRGMWGRSGMCLYWTADGQFELERSGYFSGGQRVARIVVETDAVGFRDDRGRCGPWLYIGPDGAPDRIRSGWYEEDEPVLVEGAHARGPEAARGAILPLQQHEVDDLLLVRASR